MAKSNASIEWFGKLSFRGQSRQFNVTTDAKKESGGQELGMTPKEMVLVGLCGCSGMDVISLLTSKYKLNVEQFHVSVEAESSTGGHPVVWTHLQLNFDVKGEVPEEKMKQAVELSMTKYCGVSAMLSKACPIEYTMILNGQNIGSGQAHF